MGGILGQPHPVVSSINVGSLLDASKVNRVLGGMVGSNIFGLPWLCLRMETINVGGGGTASSNSHIHMLVVSLMPHQAPSENIAEHLASKSAGHVNKQALPYCPAPREHIAVRMMNLESTAWKLRIERTTRSLSHAKRSLCQRPRQCLREWTMLFAR